ncbi:MAG: Lrp/AsnC family transcriptional regulator [Promethearchaeota archaeon]|nr:MAG: Lrp/AsnC family transcriptional regulator [Candidatus Lokiarchaeota archaeon]
MFTLSLLFVVINNKNPANQRIEFRDLFKFIISKNKGFFNIKYIFYFAILGFFGIILQLIFFFLSLKFTTISLTMIGFQLSIIIIAFYEHGNKSEKLDLFKTLYLLVLIFSIAIIIFVKLEQTGIIISANGFTYIVLFTICLTFFQIGISKDIFSKEEIKLINKNEDYKIPRLLIKISFMFFMGIGLMFPFILFIYLIPLQTDLTFETAQFFVELSNINMIIIRWEIIFLIIFTTIIPYLLIFIAYAKWSPYNLTYRQWNSILTIIEPIGSILFGFIFNVEPFPFLFLVVVLFLLNVSILLRYVHESTNRVNALILIRRAKGTMENLALKLLKYDGVGSVQYLVGTYDIMLNIKANSIRDLYYLVNKKIRGLKEIKDLEILFIDEIKKLSIS